MADGGMEEMSVDTRRGRILELLMQKGKVKVIELSKLFGISEVTIRNDLAELDEAGLLERIHGGAVRTHKAYYNLSFHERLKTNEPEKRKIAAACASMIADGDTIMINSGTTTLFTVQELRNVKNLTIVTNSVSIAQEAVNYDKVNVILLGGIFDVQYQFTYGDDTLNQLRKYKADKLILSADGISADEGITTYHHLETEVNRQMISRVNKTIVVADYTKIGRESFAYIDSIEKVDYLITDSNASSNEVEMLREYGIEVKVV
jgi:DeoR/GlpR family transcriptional regulator of sugar metabolism